MFLLRTNSFLEKQLLFLKTMALFRNLKAFCHFYMGQNLSLPVCFSAHQNLRNSLIRICTVRRSENYRHIIIIINSNPLRIYVYSNILKILPPNNENFQIKKSDIFHISSAQNIDCGYSLKIYVLSINKKNNVYPF